MALYCEQCGKKLDEATGLCPSCDADKLKFQRKAGRSDNNSADADDDPYNRTIRVEKPPRAQSKSNGTGGNNTTGNVQQHHGKKKSKPADILLTAVLAVLLMAISSVGTLVVLACLDAADIPVISDIVDRIKGNDSESGDADKHTYIPADAVEYNGHSYYVYYLDGVNTWEEAEKYCEAQGGYLAVITSAEENSFLYSYMNSCGYSSAMFGLSDSEQTDDWKWVNGESFVYSNWSAGEPNHYNGVEHYGMFYEGNADGTWNDGAGNDRRFLCEWDECGQAADAESGFEGSWDYVASIHDGTTDNIAEMDYRYEIGSEDIDFNVGGKLSDHYTYSAEGNEMTMTNASTGMVNKCTANKLTDNYIQAEWDSSGYICKWIRYNTDYINSIADFRNYMVGEWKLTLQETAAEFSDNYMVFGDDGTVTRYDANHQPAAVGHYTITDRHIRIEEWNWSMDFYPISDNTVVFVYVSGNVWEMERVGDQQSAS